MQTELKPCPFCGDAHPAFGSDEIVAAYWVKCTHCGIQIGEYVTKRSAARTWNTRATPPAEGADKRSAYEALERHRLAGGYVPNEVSRAPEASAGQLSFDEWYRREGHKWTPNDGMANALKASWEAALAARSSSPVATCMCSGLGPCEGRTDGSCRVAKTVEAGAGEAVYQEESQGTPGMWMDVSKALYEARVVGKFSGGAVRALYTAPQAGASSEDARDAERYRWLRDHGFRYANVDLSTTREGDNCVDFVPRFSIPEPIGMEYEDNEWTVTDIDAAIDAALQASKEPR